MSGIDRLVGDFPLQGLREVQLAADKLDGPDSKIDHALEGVKLQVPILAVEGLTQFEP